MIAMVWRQVRRCRFLFLKPLFVQKRALCLIKYGGFGIDTGGGYCILLNAVLKIVFRNLGGTKERTERIA